MRGCSKTCLSLFATLPALSFATTFVSSPLEWEFADTPNLVEAVVVSSRIHTFPANGETRICGWSYELDVVETFRGTVTGRISVAKEVYSPEGTVFWGRSPQELIAGGTYAIGFQPDAMLRDAAAYVERSAGQQNSWEGREFPTTWDEDWIAGAGPCLDGLPPDRLTNSFLVREVVAPLSFFKRDAVLKKALNRRDCRTDYRGRLCRARYVELRRGWWVEDDLVIGARVDDTFETTTRLEPDGMGYLAPYVGHTSADDLKKWPPLRSKSGRPIYLRQQGQGDYQFFNRLMRYEDLKDMMRKPAQSPHPESAD